MPVPLPRYRQLHPSRWGPSGYVGALQRDVPDAVNSTHPATETVRGVDGVIYDEQGVAFCGQRLFTIGEYVGARLHRERRYGEWCLITHEVADADPPVKLWCLEHADDSTTRRGHRFRPETWAAVRAEVVAVPFIPEFDHPLGRVRSLAWAERDRRAAAIELKSAELRRDRFLARAPLSRRDAATLLDLSPARVQQLIGRQRPETRDGRRLGQPDHGLDLDT